MKASVMVVMLTTYCVMAMMGSGASARRSLQQRMPTQPTMLEKYLQATGNRIAHKIRRDGAHLVMPIVKGMGVNGGLQLVDSYLQDDKKKNSNRIRRKLAELALTTAAFVHMPVETMLARSWVYWPYIHRLIKG
ncbi:RxLR effector candidate protein [Plasmodiophora brassicae]|uniref:RxLR effector candidate protein n=1 Tax=Plasmodiophora brassicae TaxID=37360 RepID=A0A0G4IMM8_PLABS|nr:secrectory protein [Plasmodiophora brassicae]CEO96360.1 hypothetical protein PBRA_005031 [Plasmodiophora brassicae]